jgi:hypothetical protein
MVRVVSCGWGTRWQYGADRAMAICYGRSVHSRNEITRVKARGAVTAIPAIVEPLHAGHDPRHVRSPTPRARNHRNRLVSPPR